MRKSQHIRTYAFLLHDLPMKFSPILPFLTRFHKKACGNSATGFTQKRHTLYVYYSRFGWRFQMIFECFSSRSIILLTITLLRDSICGLSASWLLQEISPGTWGGNPAPSGGKGSCGSALKYGDGTRYRKRKRPRAAVSWSWSKAFAERAAVEWNSAFIGGLGDTLNKQRLERMAIQGRCLPLRSINNF